MRSARAVFLDRDGVLNVAPVSNGLPKSPETVNEVEMLADAEDACRSLRQAGFLSVMITNQPDVARGLMSRAAADEINAWVADRLNIDIVDSCYHDDGDGCDCRKPLPGMILRTANDHHIDLARSFLVGDRWRDIEAGRRAGVRTVFVDRHYDEERPLNADAVAGSTGDAAGWILHQLENERS